MSRLEKVVVNRPAKGMANAAVVRRQLSVLGDPDIGEALELGCGAGEVAATLASERCCDVVGVDVDPGQVALARGRYGETARLRFVVGDACNLEFETGRFDLVVAQNVFHHVPAWRAAAAEIARVMRPGGHLLWLDLTLPSPVIAWFRPLASRLGVFTLREVRATFRDVGFVEVAMRQRIPWLPVRYELILTKRRSIGGRRTPSRS